MPNQYRLKYDPAVLAHSSPRTIRSMYIDKELHAAYTKFRREYRKRLKEINASEYAGSQIFEDASVVFGQTGRSWEPTAMVHALQEITKFLQSKESTLEGLREADQKRIQRLQEKGMDMIQTPEDLRKFGRFMDAIRPYFDRQRHNSDQAADLYNFAQMNNISIPNIKAHFGFYLEHLDEITETDLSILVGKNRGKRRKKPWTAKQLADKLGLDYDATDTIY